MCLKAYSLISGAKSVLVQIELPSRVKQKENEAMSSKLNKVLDLLTNKIN